MDAPIRTTKFQSRQLAARQQHLGDEPLGGSVHLGDEIAAALDRPRERVGRPFDLADEAGGPGGSRPCEIE